jgi:hypothetical protein
MRNVGRGVLAVVVAVSLGCGAEDTSPAARAAAAAARDSAARADSVRALEAAPTLKVTNVMIGKRVDQANRVTEPTFQFAPNETVYVSIGTVGTPQSADFEARWTNQRGERVDSSKTSIQPSGRNQTLLQAARPKGWTPGAYRITIYADGDSVDTKTFAVQKPQ